MEFEILAFVTSKLILGTYFVLKGLNYFRGEYIEANSKVKVTLNYLTAVILSLSGLGIITGVLPLLSLSMIGAYLILANAYIYNFWKFEENRETVKSHFYKNAAILGALLMLYTADWTIYGIGLTLGVF
jgi:uncharacterized membrane protein YphA (DoxX/SURF4 family)